MALDCCFCTWVMGTCELTTLFFFFCIDLEFSYYKTIKKEEKNEKEKEGEEKFSCRASPVHLVVFPCVPEACGGKGPTQVLCSGLWASILGSSEGTL